MLDKSAVWEGERERVLLLNGVYGSAENGDARDTSIEGTTGVFLALLNNEEVLRKGELDSQKSE